MHNKNEETRRVGTVLAATAGLLVLVGAAAMVALGSGCSKSVAGEQPEASRPSWQYVEGRGVRLSDWGKRVAAIELVEVGYGAVGGGIAGSGRVFARASDQGRARVTMSVPADKASGLAPGAEVTATGGPEAAEFTGRVVGIDRQLAGSAGQVELIVAIEDPAERLREGMFLNCRIVAEGGAEATTLPASAILNTVRGDFVYLLNGDYFFREQVVVGARNGGQVEILDGLFEGDVVAAAGIETLWLTELQAINGGAACADGH